jgi:hypothetical protein
MASGLWMVRGRGTLRGRRASALTIPGSPGRGPHTARGGWAVGMDAKQCRERALRCTELAERASDPHLKAVLQHLAERWLKSAAELEGSQVSQDGQEPNKPGR